MVHLHGRRLSALYSGDDRGNSGQSRSRGRLSAFALLPAHLSQLDDHADHDDHDGEDVHLSKAFHFQVFCSLQ